jgi:plastocyanin
MVQTTIVKIPLRESGVPHRFEPKDIAIKVGDTVQWVNEDEDFHTVTSVDDSFPGSDLDGVGATFSHTFDSAGEFPYRCDIHLSMKGTVEVTEEAANPNADRTA